MHVNVAIIQIAAGREAEFEAQMRASSDSPVYAADGFVSNTVLKDQQNLGRYFYTSVWKSAEALEAYRRSQEYGGAVRSMNDSGLYVGREQTSAEVVWRKAGGADTVWP